MPPIRTFSEIKFEFRLQSRNRFKYQIISPLVKKLAALGMNNYQITLELGVDLKTVKKAKKLL